MGDEISEACGVFGVFSTTPDRDIFEHLYWGLLSLNHRGQQSYGFATLDKSGRFHKEENLDLVPTDPKRVKALSQRLRGPAGIANARYATSGSYGTKHLQGGKQPLFVSGANRKIAISYNGNIVNAAVLRPELEARFGKFKTDADTEVLAKQLLLSLEDARGDYGKAVGRVLDTIEGAYSAMLLDSSNSFHAFRDIHGIRPYCFSHKDYVYAFSSETPALEINGFETFDFIRGGELISISDKGRLKRALLRRGRQAMCAFEFAYFSRPDSVLNGTNRAVYKIREAFAKSLADTYREKLQCNEVIVSVPETADDAAYGLHVATGLPWERAVRKNRYVTRRAFISASAERDNIIDKKISIVSQDVKGKSIAVVEDSIVRGDTSRINVAKLRRKGAKSVDLYVTFPKIASPCFYGVDMATYSELRGSKMIPQEIADWMNADSVNYQTVDGLVQAIGMKRSELCLGCVTGKYPTPFAQRMADEEHNSFVSGAASSKKRIYESSIRGR